MCHIAFPSLTSPICEMLSYLPHRVVMRIMSTAQLKVDTEKMLVRLGALRGEGVIEPMKL